MGKTVLAFVFFSVILFPVFGELPALLIIPALLAFLPVSLYIALLSQSAVISLHCDELE